MDKEKKDDATIIALLEFEISNLRKVLIKCQQQFCYYADSHREAGKIEKAETNQKFADMIHEAIHSPIRGAK